MHDFLPHLYPNEKQYSGTGMQEGQALPQPPKAHQLLLRLRMSLARGQSRETPGFLKVKLIHQATSKVILR